MLTALSGAEGAYYNVLINLDSLSDLDQSAEPDFAADIRLKAGGMLTLCENRAAEIRGDIRGRLEG